MDNVYDAEKDLVNKKDIQKVKKTIKGKKSS